MVNAGKFVGSRQGLLLFDQLRLKAALAVTWGIEFKLTVFGAKGFAGVTVAAAS